MKEVNFRIREFDENDIEKMVDYFLSSDDEFLLKMGIDKKKLPSRSNWIQKLKIDLSKPYSEKEFYYLLWLVDDKPIGHSNVSHLTFGDSAKMHLHIWNNEKRKSGLGLELLKLSIKTFFDKLELKKLVCEPYAKNLAPNRTLSKLGFELIKTYETTPGWINFRQPVNRYELTKSQFES